MLPQVEISVVIPFYDVDSMNIAWHGSYIKYLEDARCALLNEIGYNYKDMSESGYAWPVTAIKVKYIQPALFMQEIKVRAALAEYENRIKIKYILTDNMGGIIAKAETTQMCVKIATRETLFFSPKVFLDKLERYR
ncbi:MAG: acyl-CoA thioesterase [Deferribacteraceae bacterium]|jgi:acyl-CoA thioester hydrolase|nr:acyl-CoA thioesterase [Deferribacteraceae bacterium]